MHSIQVRINRSATHLHLAYRLEGEIERLLIPSPAAAQRADKLWQHTCFEIFLAASTGEQYFEFNFSPATQWAAYVFTGYRAGMRDIDLAPVLAVGRQPQRIDLNVTMALEQLPLISVSSPVRAAVAAVIETVDGAMSYWSLAHPAGKPDFHHRDGFVLRL